MYSNISVEEDKHFELNDRVDVQYEKEGGNYFPGRISKVNDDNTYDISYREETGYRAWAWLDEKTVQGGDCRISFMKKVRSEWEENND